MPRMRQPTLSPARPSSSSFLNISTPVTTTLRVGLTPTSSTSSPTLTMPRSMRPVATVPRPLMPNTSSTGMRNGLSMARSGVGMYESTASISSWMGLYASLLVSSGASSALSAEPRMTGMSSPGNSYLLNSSRTSSSTRSSNSGSSTMSHLFMNTTMYGTPT